MLWKCNPGRFVADLSLCLASYRRKTCIICSRDSKKAS
jgi:hypothetical protein